MTCAVRVSSTSTPATAAASAHVAAPSATGTVAGRAAGADGPAPSSKVRAGVGRVVRGGGRGGVDAKAVDSGNEARGRLGGHLMLEGHEEEVREGRAEVGPVKVTPLDRVRLAAARTKHFDGIVFGVYVLPELRRNK
jgi:hypothetical protein